MDGTRKECKYCHQSWEDMLRDATWLHKRAGYKPRQPGTPPWRSKKPEDGEQVVDRGNRELPDKSNKEHLWLLRSVTKATHPNLWEASSASKEGYAGKIYAAIMVGVGGGPAISLVAALDVLEKSLIKRKGARAADSQGDTRITREYDQLMGKMANHKTKSDKIQKGRDRKLEEAEKDAATLLEMAKEYEAMDAESKVMLTKITGTGISKGNAEQIQKQILSMQLDDYWANDLDEDKQIKITNNIRYMLNTDILQVSRGSFKDESHAQAHMQTLGHIELRTEQLCQALAETMAEKHALQNSMPVPSDDVEEYDPDQDDENLADSFEDDLELLDDRPNKYSRTDAAESEVTESMAQASTAHKQLAAASPPSGSDELEHSQLVQKYFEEAVEVEVDSAAGWQVQKTGKKNKGSKGQGKGVGKGGRGGQKV